jgi:hypothetical protein
MFVDVEGIGIGDESFVESARVPGIVIGARENAIQRIPDLRQQSSDGLVFQHFESLPEIDQ